MSHIKQDNTLNIANTTSDKSGIFNLYKFKLRSAGLRMLSNGPVEDKLKGLAEDLSLVERSSGGLVVAQQLGNFEH